MGTQHSRMRGSSSSDRPTSAEGAGSSKSTPEFPNTNVLATRISHLIHQDIHRAKDRNVPQGTIIKSSHFGTIFTIQMQWLKYRKIVKSRNILEATIIKSRDFGTFFAIQMQWLKYRKIVKSRNIRQSYIIRWMPLKQWTNLSTNDPHSAID